MVHGLRPAEVQRLIEDLPRGEVPPEPHRTRRTERARERAARLGREAQRTASVAVAHEHGLDRMSVSGAEERLCRAVLRLALGHDLEGRERHRLDEHRAQRLRERRHVVVRRGAARRPLPHLPCPVGGLAALGSVLLQQGEIHAPDGSVSPVIDLRSDTATKPTEGMRRAIAEAAVGDEQKREDPSVNALQDRVATLLGHEAAIFVPTATMANQIALKLHARPGDVLHRGGERARRDLRVRRRGRARRAHDARAAGRPRSAVARADPARRGAELEGGGSARRRCSRSRTRTTPRVAACGRSPSSTRWSRPRASSGSPSISTARGS